MEKVILPALLFVLPLAVVTFTGCQKSAGINDVGVVKSFYSLQQAKVDGVFWFQCNNLENDTVKINKAQLSGFFYDRNTTSVLSGGNVVLNGRAYNNNVFMHNDSLFGTTITVSITPPLATAAAPVTTSFYSPAPIEITNAKAFTPATVMHNKPFTITWNSDPKNTNGVNINVEYYPTELTNDSLYQLGDTTAFGNTIMVPDNGKAQLPADFFAKFPVGATIWLVAGRGNSIIVQSGSYLYQVAGFINASQLLKVGQ